MVPQVSEEILIMIMRLGGSLLASRGDQVWPYYKRFHALGRDKQSRL